LPQAPRMRKRGRGLAGPQKRPKPVRNAMTALIGPVASRSGSRFLPKVPRGRGPLYHCMGLFSRFLSRPRGMTWRHAGISNLSRPGSSVYCSYGRSPVPQVRDDG